MEKIIDEIGCKELKVDNTYQRPLIPAWLNSIKKNFDKNQIRILTVSLRENGDCYVVNGNHTRTVALDVLGPDVMLPAEIYTGLTVKDEADLFVKLNTNSKKTNYNDTLRARFASKEPLVVQYISALSESGISWAFSGGGKRGPFVGHAAGLKLFQKYGKDIFIKACQTLELGNDRTLLNSRLLGGVTYLLSNLPEKFTQYDIVNVFHKFSNDEIEKIVRMYFSSIPHDTATSTDKYYAKSILILFNRTKRKNKILYLAGEIIPQEGK